MTDSQQTLLIGVDGGGTKTTARVASVADDGNISTLGVGYGGPSNVRAVGTVHACTNLDVAIDAAHEAAGTAGRKIPVAVLGLAGSSLPDVQAVIRDWAERRQLAERIDIVHDAELLLAVGVRAGCGIGLVVGTGSVAVGINAAGERAVVGGWGHWFGDQGSGFDTGRRALTAVADAVDGIGPPTALVEELTRRLRVDDPREITRQLGRSVDIRQEIAALAPVVMHAAIDGDAVAIALIDSGARATAALVAATIQKLGLSDNTSLAMAGGIACSGDFYRDRLLNHLAAAGIQPQPLIVVSEPVEGALVMARDQLLAGS
ncbi:MAG: BadF/BadG/BcrA/BcrD ATPase family protein [Woeseia sp.]